MAAGLARLDRVAEAKHAVARDKRLHMVRFRREHPDLDAVAILGSSNGFDGLGKQPPSVERKHVYSRSTRDNGVQDRLVLDAKARRKGDRAFNSSA